MDNDQVVNVTQCHVMACLTNRFLLVEQTPTHIRAVNGSSPDIIDSIELVMETYKRGKGGASFTRKKKVETLCALDIGDGVGREMTMPRHSVESCDKILAEIDASARSWNGKGNDNPFYIMPAADDEDRNGASKVGMGTVGMAMLIVGYKTYILAAT